MIVVLADGRVLTRIPLGRFVEVRGQVHGEIGPTRESGWASWWCRWCDTVCAPGNLCDHCFGGD